MIRRRVFSLAGGLALLATQRVGILTPGSQASAAGQLAAFKQGMADFGWLGGRNVGYRIGYANGDLSRFDTLAAQALGLTIPQSLLLLRADEVIR